MTLTALETKVLALLVKNADDAAGGDFGLLEGPGKVSYKALGLSGQAFGGVLTSLQEKGLVTVHAPHYINGGYASKGTKVVQFTLAANEGGS